MTERAAVNAAQTDDGPHMPSWMDEDAVTYAPVSYTHLTLPTTPYV